jgi:hypothetical protein
VGLRLIFSDLPFWLFGLGTSLFAGFGVAPLPIILFFAFVLSEVAARSVLALVLSEAGVLALG